MFVYVSIISIIIQKCGVWLAIYGVEIYEIMFELIFADDLIVKWSGLIEYSPIIVFIIKPILSHSRTRCLVARVRGCNKSFKMNVMNSHKQIFINQYISLHLS